MTEREDFYEQRDRRTREYVNDGTQRGWFEQPVSLYVGNDAAESPRGQLAVLALVNTLARVHRHLYVQCPNSPLLVTRALLVEPPSEHTSLAEAIVAQATAIDPFLEVRLGPPLRVDAAIAVGEDIGDTVPWHVGFAGSIVTLAASPVPVDRQDGFSLGACFAACLASATLFKQVMAMPVGPLRVSAWSLEDSKDAASGPDTLGPVDVGSVLMAGAGAVGSSAAYWLRQSGIQGLWRVVDKDVTVLHNTNRSLGMTAADAGWPGQPSAPKATVAANLLGTEGLVCWFDELHHDGPRPDLILPLANGRGVRTEVSQFGEPLLLHATTSRTWEAQLHRHIAGRDDCIVCRMPKSPSKATFECSTVPIGSGGRSSDAALPFLSGTAGLLLVSGLYRLMLGE
ncbi:MAG TPA: ThiF family adenylyltransferase, partial [Phycisphaerae bacterium]|nr:ThiF family adenylyltransferase [Phycisphaerae bacterium]